MTDLAVPRRGILSRLLLRRENEMLELAGVAGLGEAQRAVIVSRLNQPRQDPLLQNGDEHDALDANELKGGAPMVQELLRGQVQDHQAVDSHQAGDLQHPRVESVDAQGLRNLHRQGGPHHEGPEDHRSVGVLSHHPRDLQQVHRRQVVLPDARAQKATERWRAKVLLGALRLESLRDEHGIAGELRWLLAVHGIARAPPVER
eukprot:UN3633